MILVLRIRPDVSKWRPPTIFQGEQQFFDRLFIPEYLCPVNRVVGG
jgi:hypothetical protein